MRAGWGTEAAGEQGVFSKTGRRERAEKNKCSDHHPGVVRFMCLLDWDAQRAGKTLYLSVSVKEVLEEISTWMVD